MANIGKYLTNAINQSITNERMSMRDRFSQELQQRRFDEANAYRDKSFMESVRQFQLGHALRQAADQRAETSLADQLQTSKQLRDLRGKAETRAEDVHKTMYDPVTGYVHQEFDMKKVEHQDRLDTSEQLRNIRTKQEARAEDVHKTMYDPVTGYVHQEFDMKKAEHQDRLDTSEQLRDIREKQDTRSDLIHKFMYGEDGTGGYMNKKMGWEAAVHNFLYGEDGVKQLEKELYEKKVDSYGKREPMTEFQERFLGPYYQALTKAAGMRTTRSSGDDNALLGTPGQSVSTTETLLNREMSRYAQELSEMLEHEDSTWWDAGKVTATTGVGAGIGTIIPGIGNLVGAGIGAGVGLIAGLIWSNDPLMSKDEALTTFSQVGNRIRAQLKRENPGATEAEINKRMAANWNALLNVRKGTGADADTTVGDRLREKIGRLSGGGMESIYAEEALKRAFVNGAVPNTQQTAPTDIENAVRQQWNKTHLPPNNPLQIINRPKMMNQ